MSKFKPNTYIEVYNLSNGTYFPIRLKDYADNCYNAINLENREEFKLNENYFTPYSYRNIWINEKTLTKIGFKEDGLIFSLNSLIIFECLVGEIKNHPYYFLELNSKHFGFAILKDDELENFKKDYNQLTLKDEEPDILKKYLFTSNINEVISKLIELYPARFNYDFFDEILSEKP